MTVIYTHLANESMKIEAISDQNNQQETKAIRQLQCLKYDSPVGTFLSREEDKKMRNNFKLKIQ